MKLRRMLRRSEGQPGRATGVGDESRRGDESVHVALSIVKGKIGIGLLIDLRGQSATSNTVQKTISSAWLVAATLWFSSGERHTLTCESPKWNASKIQKWALLK